MANPQIREKFLKTFIRFHNLERPQQKLEDELEKYKGQPNFKPSIDKNLLEACNSALNMEEKTIKKMTDEMADRLNRGKSNWVDKTQNKPREKGHRIN